MKRNYWRALFFLLVFISISSPQISHADTAKAEVYETYVAAKKLVPVLEPLLGPNDKITAFRNKLFVKAPAAVQDEILRVLMEVDRPLKNILISLRYGRIDEIDHHQDQTQGSVKIFRGSSNKDKIDVQVVRRHTLISDNDTADQSIRVLEGEQGILVVGQDYPVDQLIYRLPFKSGLHTEYRSVGDQIQVSAFVVKDQIRLEITSSHQSRNRSNKKEIEKTQAKSTLVVEPGRWMPLASSTQALERSDSRNTRSTRQISKNNASLLIRAQIVE